MKTMNKVLFILLSILFLTGCGSEEKETLKEDIVEYNRFTDFETVYDKNTEKMKITTDTETGVSYLIYQGYRKSGITPLIEIEKDGE